MEAISKTRNLGETFRQMFELVPALDDATREQVYRIRHDVYCRDLGWEPVRDDGMENDEFDRHSLHCLLRRRETGEPVGCTRLIVACPAAPATVFPFESSCKDALDRAIVDPAKLPRHRMGEVSRLAVLGTYRQRRGESSTAVSVREDDFGAQGAAARFPFVPVSLYLGAAAMASRVGVEHVFVLTEERLASHFMRIGFDIRIVGKPIEHRGLRVPSLLLTSRVIAGLRPMIRPLYAVVEAAVDAAFRSASSARRWPPVGRVVHDSIEDRVANDASSEKSCDLSIDR